MRVALIDVFCDVIGQFDRRWRLDSAAPRRRLSPRHCNAYCMHCAESCALAAFEDGPFVSAIWKREDDDDDSGESLPVCATCDLSSFRQAENLE